MCKFLINDVSCKYSRSFRFLFIPYHRSLTCVQIRKIRHCLLTLSLWLVVTDDFSLFTLCRSVTHRDFPPVLWSMFRYNGVFFGVLLLRFCLFFDWRSRLMVKYPLSLLSSSAFWYDTSYIGSFRTVTLCDILFVGLGKVFIQCSLFFSTSLLKSLNFLYN